jgi:hypothetical protein
MIQLDLFSPTTGVSAVADHRKNPSHEVLAAERERCRKAIDGLLDSDVRYWRRYTPGGIDSDAYEIGIKRGLVLAANAIDALNNEDQ